MRGNHTTRILAHASTLVLVLALAAPALAGPRDHLDGFFMRLSAGGGTASSKIEDGTDEAEISGTAGDINFAFGGIVAPNLALHGTLYGWSLSDPDLEVNGVTGTLEGDVTAAALGAGLTYYLMPANVYFSGSLGIGRLTVDGPGNFDGDTDRGLMLDVTVGKEWWVGDGWGLGVAGGMTYHSFGDGDVPENWSGTSFTLRFSATMN